MSIQRILCPTDFSAQSEAALDYAVSMARDSGAAIILLHIAEPVPLHREVPYATILDPDLTELRRQLDAIVVDPAVRVTRRVVEGSGIGTPAEAILAVASQEHCDLIVMGTHGRTGVARVLMGSVAEYLVRKAPCPVLTLKTTAPVEAKV